MKRMSERMMKGRKENEEKEIQKAVFEKVKIKTVWREDRQENISEEKRMKEGENIRQSPEGKQTFNNFQWIEKKEVTLGKLC